MNPFEEIVKLLDKNNIKYDLIEHEPVFTSGQAAKVRNEPLRQGAKSLLLKTKNGFLLAVLPGDKKLCSKKLRKNCFIKDFRFAYPEEVKTIMGCEIGACYPFGNILNLRTIVDKTLAENEFIALNPGVHNKSIKMKYKDYYALVKPETADLAD